MVDFTTPGPAEFAVWKRHVESQLAALSRPRGLQSASMAGGRIRILTEDGEERIILGRLADGSYGIEVRDIASRLLVDENGMRSPYLSVPAVAADDFQTVTAADFEVTHRGQFEVISHQGLYVWVTVTTDPGTTGEIRLRNTDPTAESNTDAVAIPAGSGGTTTQFRWLHGSTLSTGPVNFELQARRTGGSGDVNVYRPPSFTLADPSLCVAGGVP